MKDTLHCLTCRDVGEVPADARMDQWVPCPMCQPAHRKIAKDSLVKMDEKVEE